MTKSWMAVLLTAVTAATVSAIEDPSFENGRTPYKITRMKTALEAIKPETADERYVCRTDDSLAHSGRKSLFFSTSNPAGRNYLSFSRLPCEAHREYEFSIWYRMEDVQPGGRLWCEYWCYDRDGKYLQHVNGSNHDSTPGRWHQFRLRFFPVKNSRFCTVTLKFCGPMKVWVDDAAFRLLPEAKFPKSEGLLMVRTPDFTCYAERACFQIPDGDPSKSPAGERSGTFRSGE